MGMEMSAYLVGRSEDDNGAIYAPIESFKGNTLVDPKWYDGSPTCRLTSTLREIIVNVLKIDLSDEGFMLNLDEVSESYKILIKNCSKYFMKSEREFLAYSGLMNFFSICSENGYRIAAG